MPVRKPSNKGGNIIGSFPSLKNQHSVYYESTIERDLLFFLEFDQDVESYELQPFTIQEIDSQGKCHSYTPDIMVNRAKGREIIECKPTARLNHPHTKQQIKLGEAWCTKYDYDYTVVTDTDLRTGYKLNNLKLLWRYARLTVPFLLIEACTHRLFETSNGLSLSDLATYLSGIRPEHPSIPVLYHLIFQQILITDLTQPLLPQSHIQFNTLA